MMRIGPWDFMGPALRRMPNAKRIGWVIYAAGFVIWCFGYLSAGHAPAFDWAAATPWWISIFVPNLTCNVNVGRKSPGRKPGLRSMREVPRPTKQ